jgi:hypothetical protein
MISSAVVAAQAPACVSWGARSWRAIERSAWFIPPSHPVCRCAALGSMSLAFVLALLTFVNQNTGRGVLVKTR